MQQNLFDDHPEENIININQQARIRKCDDLNIVEVSPQYITLAKFEEKNKVDRAIAMIYLVEHGWASQKEVAVAFDCSTRTIRRYQRSYEKGGADAIVKSRRSQYLKPKVRSRNKMILKKAKQGKSNREIGREVGVDEKTVRNVLARMGWVRIKAEQKILPQMETFLEEKPLTDSEVQSPPFICEKEMPTAEEKTADFEELFPVLPTLDRDPMNRNVDRIFASLGLLNDATPSFAPMSQVAGAGVLIAIPSLQKHGVLEVARDIYSSIGPAFYGLRTVVVMMVLFALLRIKRPEALKEKEPQELGRIFGLDRAPEVKTLRKKIDILAKRGLTKDFGRALAKRRAELYGDAFGFLYVDGHVRVYHGKHALPKTHVSQMRKAVPATTDYWVNDCEGEPVFLVPTEANRSLTQVLPHVLEETREILGERRATFVFDRGGWSPKLFQTLIGEGFDILTYRKGRYKNISRGKFSEHRETIAGQEVCYSLCDKGVYFLKRKLRLRQVTVLGEDGHQTHIITSRRDLSAAEVTYRMFNRWRQENFFKYLSAEFALDALVDYGIEKADAHREIPNPERKKINKEVKQGIGEVCRLYAEYGLSADENREGKRPTMRGFKIAHSKKLKEIKEALEKLAKLEEKRKQVPTRVPVGKVAKGPVIKLSAEKKQLTDILKMVAYQLECDLVKSISPFYRRSEDEGRTLVQDILFSSADIEINQHGLHIKYAPLSSPHRTAALKVLCEKFTQRKVNYPGTNLRMHFFVKPPPPQGMAFPGAKCG